MVIGMKKRGHKSFWGQKQLIIAGAIMVVAAAAMTWVYLSTRDGEQEKQIAKTEDTEKEQVVEDTEDPAESVTKILQPKQEEESETATVAANTENNTDNSNQTPTDSTNSQATASAAEKELHFSADTGLNWPLQGNVILNYSMDQTVYFATLDQYKYNPAVIIAGAVNDRVSSAAAGQITDISNNEETGCTVTVDLGDGYTAIYGQLKEVPYEVGDYVESGSTIGYLSEPTKYYSVEGCNLFFELEKDGSPIDPVTFFE